MKKLEKEMEIPNELKLYSVAEAAKILKTSPNCIYMLIERGCIKVLEMKSIRITYNALIEFINKYDGNPDLKEVWNNEKSAC